MRRDSPPPSYFEIPESATESVDQVFFDPFAW